ncbi:MAG: hypothetical protein ABSE69_09025 [Roseiarcus sp.]
MEIEQNSLPGGWRWASLAEVITSVQSGFATSERARNGAIQLRTNNITRGGAVDFADMLRVPAPDNASQFDLVPGDIVFNNTNSQDLVGKTAIFEGYPERVFWSNHLSRIRVRREFADPVWVGRWLHYLWQKRLFSELATRWVGQAAVQKDKLLLLPIPLPPISVQRRIVAMLTECRAALNAVRAGAQAIILDCENLSKVVIREQIPATEADAQSRGWRWGRLAEFAQINPGRDKIDRSWDCPTSFIPMEAVDELSGKAAARLRPFGEISRGYTFFREGDVLFARRRRIRCWNWLEAISSGLRLSDHAARSMI